MNIHRHAAIASNTRCGDAKRRAIWLIITRREQSDSTPFALLELIRSIHPWRTQNASMVSKMTGRRCTGIIHRAHKTQDSTVVIPVRRNGLSLHYVHFARLWCQTSSLWPRLSSYKDKEWRNVTLCWVLQLTFTNRSPVAFVVSAPKLSCTQTTPPCRYRDLQSLLLRDDSSLEAVK